MRLDKKFSDDVSAWVVKTNRPSSEGDPVLIGLKIGEETGELLGAILDRKQGSQRGYGTKHVLAEAGDVLIALARLAAIEGTTLEEIAEERWATISLRTRLRHRDDPDETKVGA